MLRATLVALLLPLSLPAQAPRALVREAELRKAPLGVALGALTTAAKVVPGRQDGQYVEVALEGWVFNGSLADDRREGFDLAIAAANGEWVRAAPNGAILAKLRKGTLVTRVEKQGAWTRIRRGGWIALANVEKPAAAPAPAATGPAPPPAQVRPAPITAQ
ncbi:MAG: hypothetical protein NW201_14960, partial [Gemmatimonadales bacterium]|nr:hypothetical protein [Gemmatimonadales bacterium]